MDDLIACGRNRKRVNYKLVQGCLMAELRARGHEDPDAIRRGFLAGAFFDDIFSSIIVNETLGLDGSLSLVREALDSENPSVRCRGAELGEWSQAMDHHAKREQFVGLLADRWRVEEAVEVRNKLARAMRGGCEPPVLRLPMEPSGDVIRGPWHRRGRGKRRARR